MAGVELEIVTPSRRLLAHVCDDVYLPGSKGETGVLPDHAAMVSTLTTGAVHYEYEGKQRAVAVKRGFFQISENRLMILADEAVEAGDIDVEALKEARKDIDAKFVSAEVGIEERKELEEERAWIEAQEDSLSRWSATQEKLPHI